MAAGERYAEPFERRIMAYDLRDGIITYLVSHYGLHTDLSWHPLFQAGLELYTWLLRTVLD